MGAHFEIVLSVFLRDDTDPDVLAELRFHLGLAAERPSNTVLSFTHPELAANPRGYLPGAERADLRRQYRHTQSGVDRYAWGLDVRQFWGDDQWAEVWWPLVTWLAPSAEDGYAGFYREERSEWPTLFLIRAGIPYICEFGEEATRIVP